MCTYCGGGAVSAKRMSSNFVRKMMENIPRAPLTKLRRDVRLKTYIQRYYTYIYIIYKYYVLRMHAIVHRSLLLFFNIIINADTLHPI